MDATDSDLGFRGPSSDRLIGFGPYRSRPDDTRSRPIPPGSATQRERKDFVTFLEALSSIPPHSSWLRHHVVNALDGAKLGKGYSFSVRRHVLGKRVHTDRRRLVPGDTVILKTGVSFQEGQVLLPSNMSDGDNGVMAFIRELQVLTHQRVRESPYLVDLLELIWEWERRILRPVLMLEYADCGTLRDFILSDRAPTLDDKIFLCLDVLKGLNVLHGVGVIHGDIKCDNVVVFRQSDGSFRAKLIDFGFSIFLAELQPGDKRNLNGTQPFMPPECSRPIAKESMIYADYFSFGMLVWQMLSNEDNASLFCQEPFECPRKEDSNERWSNYIQKVKLQSNFIDMVEDSIRFRIGDIENSRRQWEDICVILRSTIDPTPDKRSITQLLRLSHRESSEEPDRAILAAMLQFSEAENSLTPIWMGGELFHTIAEVKKRETFLDILQFRDPVPSLHRQIIDSLEKIFQRKPNDKRAADACFALAQCRINGFGSNQLDESGLNFLTKAAERGHHVAQLVRPYIRAAMTEEINRQDANLSDLWQSIDAHNNGYYQNLIRNCLDQILESSSEIATADQMSNLTERQGSVMHWAATFGLKEQLKRLIQKFPSLIHATNANGETPLICASRHGHVACVLLLVGNGADVGHVSSAGETALHWLVSFPDDIVEVVGEIIYREHLMGCYGLASYPAPIVAATGLFIVPGTPLHRAVALRRRKVVEFLLDRNGSCFFSGYAKYNTESLERAGVLTEYRLPDMDEISLAPIHLACQRHDYEMIEFLLDKESLQTPKWSIRNSYHPGLFALQVDCDDGLGCTNLHSMSLLGYACNPINRFSRMAIHGHGQKKALKQTFEILLSKPGQNLNRVTFSGKSALLVACFADDTELILHILSLQGSNTALERSFVGGWGKKPLHIAAGQNNDNAVKALLDAGADSLARSSSGQTAIHFCASGFLPDQAISKNLLSVSPELASIASYWETPFSAAVRNHDFDCARLLLEYGADPNQLFGPKSTTTTLFQVLASGTDFGAVHFLLELPNISDLVSPRKKFKALHAPLVANIRYNYDGYWDLTEPSAIFNMVLEKWNSKDDLESREIRGFTPLHYACMTRDIRVAELILKSMRRVGADVNIMSQYFGSPVWYTPLDLIERVNRVPKTVVERGSVAVERYNEKIENLRSKLVEYGGKHRVDVLADKWGDLSLLERLKATLLTNKVTRLFALWAGFWNIVWLSGTDGLEAQMRMWTESNPEEVNLY